MKKKLRDSIAIKRKYAEIILSFNTDLQSAVDLALQRYLIDQLMIKIAELKKKDKAFQLKYDCNYDTFCRHITQDEKYVNQIEKNINKLWEKDQADWEFCHKGIGDWTKQLQNILMML
ncbi:conserved hypothetical protein [Candidatus Magnetomoraceae bacterium gMMP-15]